MFSEFIAIGLFVNDFRGAFEFYRDVLKLKIKTEDIFHEFAEFQIGDVTIGLVSPKTANELISKKYTSGNQDDTNFTLTVKVDALDSTVEALKAKGVEIITEPKIMPWGWRVACIRDNQGFIWEICEVK